MNRDQHIEQVLRAYPGWRRFRDRKGARLEGVLRSENRTGGRVTFHMKVIVPSEFPRPGVHPRAQIVSHDLRRPLNDDAHVDSDGVLCVQMEERNEIDYQRDGLLAFMQQVELHLARIRIWSLTGQFPGPQYSHGEHGRREYLAEVKALRAPFEAAVKDLPQALHLHALGIDGLPSDAAHCPCGSAARFETCHKSQVLLARDAVRELGPQPMPLMPRGSGPMLDKLNRFLRNRRG